VLRYDKIRLSYADGKVCDGSVIQDSRLRAYADAWKDCQDPNHSFPTLTDLDVIRLGKAGLLPFLWLIERLENKVWRYRLVGEAIRDLHNKPMRGHTTVELFGSVIADDLNERWSRIVDDAMALRTYGYVFGGENRFFGERLLLPFKDGNKTELILGCTLGEYTRSSHEEADVRGFNTTEICWIPTTAL